MILQGDRSKLLQELARMCPDIPKAPAIKLQMLDYQMAALYVLARRYDRRTARMLEIGTGHGGSGYMLAKAAPMAKIISLTTNPNEREMAQAFWTSHDCLNITALVMASWDYYKQAPATARDLIFVDGDHNHIARDLPWFNRLTIGGLFLCHDYAPKASPIVFRELNTLAAVLGRPFDVSIIDDGKVGMVGFYRREGETA